MKLYAYAFALYALVAISIMVAPSVALLLHDAHVLSNLP